MHLNFWVLKQHFAIISKHAQTHEFSIRNLFEKREFKTDFATIIFRIEVQALKKARIQNFVWTKSQLKHK